MHLHRAAGGIHELLLQVLATKRTCLSSVMNHHEKKKHN